MFSAFLLTVLTAVPFLGLPVSASPTCSESEFNACIYMFQELANNLDLGFAVTEQELNKLCGHVREAMQCVDDYINRCYDESQREAYRTAISGTEQLLSDLCTRGSEFRAEYLRHSVCYKSVRPEYEKCTDGYKHQHESSITKSDVDVSEKVKKSCCLIDFYKECTREAVLSKCGLEAAEFGVQFVTKGPLVEVLCVDVKHDSQDCSFLSSGLSSTAFSSLHNFYLGILIALNALYYLR